MKKVGVVLAVALLLIPVLAGPADAWWRGGGFHHGGWGGGRFGGGFAFGLGVGALLTAPFWCCPSSYAYPAYGPAYAYPAYAYPAYSYPAYSYPPYGTAEAYAYPTYAPPPAAPSATSPTPEPLSSAPSSGTEAKPAPQASTQNCQAVQVEGHYETRVLQNGQRVTAWIPAYSQQVCQ